MLPTLTANVNEGFRAILTLVHAMTWSLLKDWWISATLRLTTC
jgi:hypothetical protein